MTTHVQKNEQDFRYEMFVDGQLVGIADYLLDGDSVIFPHTQIRRDKRGHGYGNLLVRAALDDVKKSKRRIVPRCWYVARFVEMHPEYEDMLAA